VKKAVFIAIFLLSCASLFAQSADTLLHVLQPIDSLYSFQLQTLDSLQRQTELQCQAIKNQYDSINNAYTNITNDLQSRIDSLNNIGQPLEKFTSKLDSLNRVKEEKLFALKQKVENVKQKTKEKINGLNLPKEVSGEVSKYTTALDQLDITLPASEFKIPAFNLKEIPNLSMPNVNSPLSDELGKLKIPEVNTNLSAVTDKISAIQQELPETPTMEDVATKAEEKATELASEKMGDISGAPELPASEEQAKEMLVTEAKKQAIDHFAGKQDKLQAAMDQMSKYKQRYSNVQSIKDLPKKLPNEMHGKPLRERIVPGLSIQIQKRNDWWFDFNPYLGYRFTGRITAGLGWNHRIAFNFNKGEFNPDMYIYGPRSYGEFRIKKGFSGRLEVEVMNTPVRIPPSQDFAKQEWVWSAMAGLKKEYRISKSLRGNAQILYNLFNPHYKSPYTDRLNMRIGIEYKIPKKKPKEQNKN
jgi:archaellum component FlaC